MSVDDVLNYKPNENENYYALLGCDESSTVSRNFFLIHLVKFYYTAKLKLQEKKKKKK